MFVDCLLLCSTRMYVCMCVLLKHNNTILNTALSTAFVTSTPRGNSVHMPSNIPHKLTVQLFNAQHSLDAEQVGLTNRSVFLPKVDARSTKYAVASISLVGSD